MTRKEIQEKLKISKMTFFRRLKKGKIKQVTPVTIPQYVIVEE